MSNKTISMVKIKQFIRLNQQGYSQRRISQTLKIHRDTIRKYEHQLKALGICHEELLQKEEAELEGIFEKYRPRPVNQQKLNNLYSFFPYADKELSRVGVDRYNLWQEYRQKYADGYGYSHFCREYKRYKIHGQFSSHFEHKAGDKLFVDFTGSKLHIVDRWTGECKEVEVLVGVLGHSQYTYVEAVSSQKKEDFIAGIENALYYFNGVPQGIVTDNLRSAVTRSCRYEPKVNETFEGFALYYGTVILPTRSYKPKDKALVEGAVNIVYKRIFAPLRNEVFYSLAELNKAIREQLAKHNSSPFKAKDHNRLEVFEQVEKAALTPLPVQRYDLKNYTWSTVQKNSHVCLQEDKHYYSVPYQHIGRKVKLVYGSRQVEIYYNHNRIAAFIRERKSFAYTTEPGHLPSSNRFVSEWNPKYFTDWAADIGAPTKELIEKIIEYKLHPEQAYKACVGVLSFAKKLGKQRLNDACGRALYYENYSYHAVKTILAKGLDSQPILPEAMPFIAPHQNIRGRSYYQ